MEKEDQVYAEIDPILSDWAKEKGLKIEGSYYHDELYKNDYIVQRLIRVSHDKSGLRSPEIWITRKSKSMYEVNIGLDPKVSHKSITACFLARRDTLKGTLEQAYQQLLSWISNFKD